jgi:hypothetical protein
MQFFTNTTKTEKMENYDDKIDGLEKDNVIGIPMDFEDPELSENQEKIEALTDKQKEIIEDVSEWLISKRNYKDYDIDPEFKVEKIMPLLRFIEHDEISFNDDGIVQNLRSPLELKDKKGNTVKTISKLNYKIRYKAFELNNYTKGINLAKEMNLYMDAQVGMLCNVSRSIIGKLFDTDHSLTRSIQSLYFL